MREKAVRKWVLVQHCPTQRVIGSLVIPPVRRMVHRDRQGVPVPKGVPMQRADVSAFMSRYGLGQEAAQELADMLDQQQDGQQGYNA